MSKQCGAFFVFFKIVVPMFIKLWNFLLFDIPQCFCVFKSTCKARNQPLNSQCCHAVLTCVYHASLQQALQFEEVVFFVVRKSAVPLMALLYLLVAYYGKCKNKTKQNSALLPLSINLNACIFLKLRTVFRPYCSINITVESSVWEEVWHSPLPCGKPAFVHRGSIFSEFREKVRNESKADKGRSFQGLLRPGAINALDLKQRTSCCLVSNKT